MDLLKITHKEVDSSCAHSLTILGCNSSGPGVLLTFKHCRADATCSWEDSTVDRLDHKNASLRFLEGRILFTYFPFAFLTKFLRNIYHCLFVLSF